MNKDSASIIRLFAERSAYWTSQGYHGAAVYDALGNDPTLPENFEPEVAAAIVNLLPSGLKDRRKRGDPPSFIRVGQNAVIYPRHAYCQWLKARFVERSPPSAADEYTQVPAAE